MSYVHLGVALIQPAQGPRTTRTGTKPFKGFGLIGKLLDALIPYSVVLLTLYHFVYLRPHPHFVRDPASGVQRKMSIWETWKTSGYVLKAALLSFPTSCGSVTAALLLISTKDLAAAPCLQDSNNLILFVTAAVYPPFFGVITSWGLQDLGRYIEAGCLLSLGIMLYQGFQAWGFLTMLPLRTGLDTAAGDDYEDNDWGYGQVLAIFAWLPTLIDLIYWCLRIAYGGGKGTFDIAWSMDRVPL